MAKLLIYIKTGYLLHLITLGELLVIYIMLHTLNLGAWMMEGHTAVRVFILLPFLWAPIFPQLDARSRYQNYKMAKDYFYQYGFDARLVKHLARSRCQRDAVIAAARELGVGQECAHYFKACGYKWYHLFPDIIFENPVVLLSRQFWVTTFFTKTYHPKFSCYAIKPGQVKNVPALQTEAA